MYYNKYKNSRLTRYTWLGIAVFFVVFCSCPVKKYIRLQLYKHNAISVNNTGDHFSRTDIKDCTIAEREDKANINQVFYFHAGDDAHSDFVCFTNTALSPYSRTEYQKIWVQGWANHPIILFHSQVPLYLQIRHLQI